MSINGKLKSKKCRCCKLGFTPWNSLQVCCTPSCAIEYTKNKQETKLIADINRAEKIKRADTKKRKEALKSKSKWLGEAQIACNAHTRERDKGDVCISCGKSEAELKINNPIAMVCGHYLSVGAYPELRFHPFNQNLQCTRCNGGAGKYGQFNSKGLTVTQDYRINLIKKIGLSNVEWLEGPQKAQNLIIEDIKEIKQYYKERLKIIKG